MDPKSTTTLERTRRDLGASPLAGLLSTAAPLHLPSSSAAGPAGVAAPVVGKLVGISSPGAVLVDFAGNPTGEPLRARHICPLQPGDVQREVLLVFENSDPEKPIILGLLQLAPPAPRITPEPAAVQVSLDGEQVILSAQKEIVLRCGKASITLTRAGKVLIRGAYVLSRSSGAHRIKGGSVQIN